MDYTTPREEHRFWALNVWVLLVIGVRAGQGTQNISAKWPTFLCSPRHLRTLSRFRERGGFRVPFF